MRMKGRRGQTTIEFSFVAVVFVLMLLSVLEIGVAQFQKSSFDYSISRMADELPDGWESMDAKTVAKDCISKAAGIPADDIEVHDAEIHVEDEGSTELGNSTATALGSELKTETAKYLDLKADISVKLGRGLGLIGNDGTEYRRNVDKTFTIERRWEVA